MTGRVLARQTRGAAHPSPPDGLAFKRGLAAVRTAVIVSGSELRCVARAHRLDRNRAIVTVRRCRPEPVLAGTTGDQ